MSFTFIQLSAVKDSDNFAFISNLSLMDSSNLTPAQAEKELNRIADEMTVKGYSVEILREEMSDEETAWYADLIEAPKI